MAIRIAGHQMKVQQEVRDHLEAKLPRLEKHTNRLQSVDVVLEKDASMVLAEIRVKSGPIEATAKGRSNKALVAVDQALTKIESQLRKKLEKLRGNKKHTPVASRGAKNGDLESQPVRPESRIKTKAKPKNKQNGTAASVSNGRRNGRHASDESTPADVEPLLLEKLNVRVFQSRRSLEIRMDVRAAAEELYLNDDHFLCFINKETGEMNVVYRRKDGNLAIIEPQPVLV
jgi:ribosomal subunit interface protein